MKDKQNKMLEMLGFQISKESGDIIIYYFENEKMNTALEVISDLSSANYYSPGKDYEVIIGPLNVIHKIQDFMAELNIENI